MKKDVYLVNNNKYLSFFLKIIDFLTLPFFKKNKINLEDVKPKKILLCNIAHLGDVVLSTSILPVLKNRFPDIKISFLCASWSQDILKNHHMIENIYCFDHWKLNRSKISFFKKIKRHLQTQKKAIKQIKKEKFCLAIDLRYHFPNSTFFLSNTKIPIRLAYTSGGFKNFLTHKINWYESDNHVTKYHIDLINTLLKYKINDKQLAPCLSKIEDDKSVEDDISVDTDVLKDIKSLLFKDYYIVHIGAGDNK